MKRFTYRDLINDCVWGGQGSPQGSDSQSGPAKTPGSSMNRRMDRQSASRSQFSSSLFRGAAVWIPLFIVLALFGLSSLLLHAESANSFFKRGQAAEAHEDYDAALENYQKACAKDPKDLGFRSSLYRVRVTASAVHLTKGYRLMNAGSEQEALSEFLHAAEIDPGNEAAQQAIANMRKKLGEVVPAGETSIAQPEGAQENLDSMGSPAVLRPVSNEPVTLHMQEDSKVIYQAIGKAAGVNVLFDPEYTSKRIQVDLNNVSLLDALRIVGTISNTFWRPVTDNTIFVALNTKGKRTELDEEAVQTFYLSNAWQQTDLTDVQTAIRNVLTNVKIYAVPSQNAIVIRATPDELLLAQKLINDLDRARPEVVVDIAILEVSKTWERNLGIAWPSSVGVALQSPTGSSTTSTTGTTTTTGSTSTSASPTLYDLSHLKASNFAVTINGATANLLLNDSNTKVLQNPRIRATDAQKAIMKIGERVPIATGSYGGGGLGGVGGVGGLGIGVQTQFQYQDVGVNIEMTPTVHFDRDVTLKIKIEVSSEGAPVTISGVTEPIFNQRVVDQVIRLREGEASILGGIQEKSITESWSGIPGLSSIPILRYLFGSKDHTVNDDDLVFLIVPHVVRSQSLDALNLRPIDTGVGQSVDIRHVPSDGPGSNAPSNQAPPVRQPAAPRSSVGTVPGGSAAAAAPTAIAQMRQAAEMNGNSAATALPAPAANLAPAPPMAAPGPAPSPVPGQPTAQTASVRNQSVSLILNPPSGPMAVGATFQVPVVLTGGMDIASVPFRIQYDSSKLSLLNVVEGDFLGQDGKVPTLIHQDDPEKSMITVNNVRPPGAPGLSGAGVVCVLSFQTKAVGDSAIAIAGSGVTTSAMQPVAAKGNKITVQVR